MANKFDEMREAMREARSTMYAADNIANDMADMLEGRLRKVSGWKLKKLKRELKKFNMHTQRWMDD